MGYASMVLSLGLLTDPMTGGVLYEYGEYFQVFIPTFSLIVVEMILRCMSIGPEKRPRGPNPDRNLHQTWTHLLSLMLSNIRNQ